MTASLRTDTDAIPVIEGSVANTRYYTLHARLRRLAARVRRSPFARDLRHGVTEWVLPVLGGALGCYLLIVGLRIAFAVAHAAGVAP